MANRKLKCQNLQIWSNGLKILIFQEKSSWHLIGTKVRARKQIVYRWLHETTPYQLTNSPDNIIPQMTDYSRQHHTNRQIHQTTSYHRWSTTADNTIPTNSPDNIIPQMTDYRRQHHTNKQISTHQSSSSKAIPSEMISGLIRGVASLEGVNLVVFGGLQY